MRGRLCKVDLLCKIGCLLKKILWSEPVSTRRWTVLILSLQWGFPAIRNSLERYVVSTTWHLAEWHQTFLEEKSLWWWLMEGSRHGENFWFQQGTLTEREGSVQLTSSYQLVCISCLWYCKHYLLFYKTSNLNEEVNCTKPSLSVSVPWFQGFYASGRSNVKLTKSASALTCGWVLWAETHIMLTTGVNVINSLTVVSCDRNKLECLSVASLSNLI
jgi:hypothetical protein